MSPARSKPTTRRTSRPTPKPRPVHNSGSRVEQEDIHLVPGTGSRGRGDGPGGHYWHVYVGAQRVGYVFIRLVDVAELGQHASITIQINRTWQGRGVGRVAYRLACEQSAHGVVYAHMRRSNHASRRAAELAGFIEVPATEARSQLTMCWTRTT